MTKTLSETTWIYPIRNRQREQELCAQWSCTPVLAQILVRRGLDSDDVVHNLLHAGPTETHDPFLLKDMDVAIARIRLALERQEGVLVHGDYDVDGVTSSSLMVLGLRHLGFKNVSYFLPNRLVHGYGVNEGALRKAKEDGFSLLITCDCGISALEALRVANEIGLDVIVTDHHEPKDELPRALAVINPKRRDCPYPFKHLAGVGVAFKVLQALGTAGPFWDLVTLGTIADVVPLTGENRLFVKHGLNALKNTPKPGLQALLEVAGLVSKDDKKDGEEGGKDFSAGQVAFQVAPRINAIGRLGDPTDGLRMIISDDLSWARTIAELLDSENQRRKAIEHAMCEEAYQIIDSDSSYAADRVLVLYRRHWHQGVMGIVASRVVERYHKPALVLAGTSDDDHAASAESVCKGSCRSIPAFHMLKALDHVQEHLQHYGGHAYAAGFSILEFRVPLLRQALNRYAADCLTEEDLRPKITVDAVVALKDLSEAVYDDLELLAPYGAGHVTPLLAACSVRLAACPRVVGQKHLRLELIDSVGADLRVRPKFTAMAFHMGPAFDELYKAFRSQKPLDVAFQLQRNTWQGRMSLQLHIKGWRYSEY